MAHVAIRKHVGDIEAGERIWFGPLPDSDGGWSDPVYQVKSTKTKTRLTFTSGHEIELPVDTAIIVRLDVDVLGEVPVSVPDDRERPDMVEAFGLDKSFDTNTGEEILAAVEKRDEANREAAR